MPLPGAGTRLTAAAIVAQLKRYDPGRLLRCEVEDDAAYRSVVDLLGGVPWGYNVQILEDKSRPEFRLGPPPPPRPAPTQGYPSSAAGATDQPAPRVEIEEADIVALSEQAALFYSTQHGLFLVDLTGPEPRFRCAVQLPGQVRNFFFYRDHLVAMVGARLLHFKLREGGLKFVEAVELRGAILDTRRFNDKLVVYTQLALTAPNASASGAERPAPVLAQPSIHRALQVFRFGEQLTEELNESLINNTVDKAFLQASAVNAATPVGSVLHTASSYGDVLWASDRYFVVTEFLDVTKLDAWVMQNYQVCTRSHSVESSYRHCYTRYEKRPNPNYAPPDNSSGDRACKGITLADCLRQVARASNPTVQVPVGTSCEERKTSTWVCDAYEAKTREYPRFTNESATRLTIYEYTEQGFVRLDGKVRSIVTHGELDGVPLTTRVDKLTTSSETFDLSIPGRLQTLNFQNGFLYAVSSGTLQVYSMGENSLVRTSSLRVANETLQSSLFASNKLYLSDFGFRNGMDESTLRVIDLSSGGFPTQVSTDYRLPGGHSSILPTRHGILTIGSVANFENTTRNAVKLGLFADPFSSEKAYLILATELSAVSLSDRKAHYFDASASRLFLPYTGLSRAPAAVAGSAAQLAAGPLQARVGISHLADEAIVSDGAVQLIEPVQRVRERPGAADQLLGFSNNTVVWLRPATEAWKAEPVLNFYTPFALYRLSDSEDYVEVSRLGERCKLHFARAAELKSPSTASAGTTSEAFPCGGGLATAYGNNLLFGATGVSFDDDGKVTPLEPAKVTELFAKVAQRSICLFSSTPSDARIDYAKLPPSDALKCYTRAEYQTLLGVLAAQAQVDAGAQAARLDAGSATGR